jgi:hypothetical protein
MDKDTLLLRQVHPSFVQGEDISSLAFTSQTFIPTEKDDDLLSVYNGNKFTAEESHSHFEDQGFKSAVVVSVSNKDCKEEDLDVHEDDIPFDGHCSIDYSKLESKKAKTKKAKKLKKRAQDKGWLFIKEEVI